MCNSIENEITDDIIVSEIKLLLDSHKNDGKILVLLEGYDDKKLYPNFFDSCKVDFHLPSGCGRFKNILDSLCELYKEKFLIIKDSDFDRLNGILYSEYENLFLTDAHDSEISLLNEYSESRLCQEYLQDIYPNLFSSIFSDLKNISYIKWFSNKNKLDLNVKKISNFGDFYRKNSFEISIEWCLEQCNSIPSNVKIEKNNICEFIENNKTVDFFQLTNGHDFCKALAIKINSLNENKRIKGIDDSSISSSLRLLYTIEFFKKSDLFNSLKNWQDKNNICILK